MCKGRPDTPSTSNPPPPPLDPPCCHRLPPMPRRSNESKRLASVSLADLQSELARRSKQVDGLRKRRDALLREVSAINAQIGDEPSMAPRRGPGRPKGSKNRRPGVAASVAPGRSRAKNTVTLADALAAVLKDKVMGVAEASDAIRKAGYKSNASSFRIMVNGALTKPPFKRVSRGKYTVK